MSATYRVTIPDKQPYLNRIASYFNANSVEEALDAMQLRFPGEKAFDVEESGLRVGALGDERVRLIVQYKRYNSGLRGRSEWTEFRRYKTSTTG